MEGAFIIIGISIIGAAMLYGLIRFINKSREEDNAKPLGCLAITIICVVVIAIWILSWMLV
jgi:uncharacterized membrane protein YidH (DUF202 family)